MLGAVRFGSLLATTSFAFAQDVDWKLYGWADLGVVSVCFAGFCLPFVGVKWGAGNDAKSSGMDLMREFSDR